MCHPFLAAVRTPPPTTMAGNTANGGGRRGQLAASHCAILLLTCLQAVAGQSPPPLSPPPVSSLCSAAILCFESDYQPAGPSTTWVDMSGHNNLSFYSYASSTSTAWTPTVTPTTSSASGLYFPGNSGNGNGYYAMASTAVTIGTSFTSIIRLWPTTSSGPPFLWCINRNSAGATNEAGMQQGYFGDVIGNGVNGFGGTAGIPNGNLATFPVQIPLNQWSHLAFVRSGTNGYYYLNGVSVANVTASSSVSYGTANFAIGCDYRNLVLNVNPRCFSGYISTFVILNSALSSTQVAGDYYGASWANPPPPSPPGPPPPFPPYYHARAAFLSNTQNGGTTACLFQSPGLTVCSPNGAWCLVFQSTDANLAMYKTGGGAIWGLNTITEPTCVLCLAPRDGLSPRADSASRLARLRSRWNRRDQLQFLLHFRRMQSHTVPARRRELG